MRGVLLGLVLTRCVPCPDIGNIGAIMTTLCSGKGISVAGLALVCAAAGLVPRPRPVAGRTHQL